MVVTGASGFVGGWLQRELVGAGHQVVSAPPSGELDIADADALRRFLADAAPDAVAHLAAVTAVGAAAADPERAMRTNVGGTKALMEAAGALPRPPALLVVGSAAVYAPPPPEAPPLAESARLGPGDHYGLSKLAQETVALDGAERSGVRLAIARPFGVAGPGQPPIAALPSFVQRVLEVHDGHATVIRVGNLDVERDFVDVRDMAHAFRQLLEALAGHEIASPAIFNVASGTGTSLRAALESLCRLAGVAPEFEVDAQLVRANDPPRIVGDASALRAAVGWRPGIPLSQTLADMLAHHSVTSHAEPA